MADSMDHCSVYSMAAQMDSEKDKQKVVPKVVSLVCSKADSMVAHSEFQMAAYSAAYLAVIPVDSMAGSMGPYSAFLTADSMVQRWADQKADKMAVHSAAYLVVMSVDSMAGSTVNH